MKKPKIKESEILTCILDYLRLRRVFHYRNNSGGAKFGRRFVRFGSPGSPDIICVIHGHFIGIEVKTAEGFQSQQQITFMTEVRKAGGTYFLARSLDDVRELFEVQR